MKQGGGDDEQLCAAFGQVGAYYTERGKWGKAAQYFKQAKDLEMMAECYYRCVLGVWQSSHATSRCRFRDLARGHAVVLSRRDVFATKCQRCVCCWLKKYRKEGNRAPRAVDCTAVE